MEDLGSWQSIAPGVDMSKEQAILCLQNVAVLHAKYWGNEKAMKEFGPAKPDKDYRGSHYNKIAAKIRKGKVENIQGAFKKLLEGEWPSNPGLRIRKGGVKPDWLTIAPDADGSYCVLKDPMVAEVFKVMQSRFPHYNQMKSKPFIKRPTQTICHGDFHAGNHMYGTGDNEGKVKALDFQLFGAGMVAIDFVYLLYISWGVGNYDEVEELAKGKQFMNLL